MTTMLSLTKGANAPVAADVIRVTITWDRSVLDFEIDACALLCGADGHVRNDDDFVFYNQPSHPSGAVRRVDLDFGDGIPTEILEVNLLRVPEAIGTVQIVASTQGTFGQIPNVVARVVDAASGAVLLEFPVDGDRETAMVAGELYRRGGAWKFRAIGQGYADGLAGLARDFGIAVDDPRPGPAASTAPAPVPQPTPAAVPGPLPTPAADRADAGIDWLNPPVPAGYEI